MGPWHLSTLKGLDDFHAAPTAWAGRRVVVVVVVEDQEDLREIARFALEGAGYEVIEAATGAEGIAKAETEHPDLVLMDIQLPVLDGYESTRRIKALPGMERMTVIAVSSFAMRGDEEKARAAGCDGYVTKPYSPNSWSISSASFWRKPDDPDCLN